MRKVWWGNFLLTASNFLQFLRLPNFPLRWFRTRIGRELVGHRERKVTTRQVVGLCDTWSPFGLSIDVVSIIIPKLRFLIMFLAFNVLLFRREKNRRGSKRKIDNETNCYIIVQLPKTFWTPSSSPPPPEHGRDTHLNGWIVRRDFLVQEHGSNVSHNFYCSRSLCSIVHRRSIKSGR